MSNSSERYTGMKLRAVLQAQGRRQDWLAAQAGVSVSLISRLISGERTVNSVTAERIATALQVPLVLAFDVPMKPTTEVRPSLIYRRETA